MVNTNASRYKNIVHSWDLLSNLVRRDIKLHYHRSILGILWSQINPLVTLIMFSIVFTKIVPLGVPNYPAYVFSGLLLWTWFSSTLVQSPYSLKQSRDLVRRPRFATEMIVVVSVATNLVNLLLSLPVLICLLLINGIVPDWTLIFFPIVLLVQFLFTLGLTLILSSISVFLFDIVHIVGLATTMWFYITPVFYRPVSSGVISFIENVNPMAQFVTMARQILLYHQAPDLKVLLVLTVFSMVLCWLGLRIFRRFKYNFVDEL